MPLGICLCRTLEDFLKYDELVSNTDACIARCRGENGADWVKSNEFDKDVKEFVFSFRDHSRALPWPFPDHPPEGAAGGGAGAGDGAGRPGGQGGPGGRDREGRQADHRHDPYARRLQQHRAERRLI